MCDLWDRGVGPGLIVMIGDVPGAGRAAARSVTWVAAQGSAVLGHLAAQLARGLTRRVPAVDESPGWCLVLEGDVPQRRRVDETLLTVADGRVGTRGSVEEDGPGSDPLVVAAGVYDTRDPLVALLPGPGWIDLEVDHAELAGQRRVLDLRTGVVTRDCALPGGRLRTLRFAAAARPGAAELRAEAPVGSLRTGRGLQPPATAAGYESGVRDGVVWAQTSSMVGGGIVSAAAQSEGVAGDVGMIERLVATRADPGTLRSVRWTVDTLGWQGTSGGQSVATVRARVLANLRPGAIVLMHVGSHPRDGSTLDCRRAPPSDRGHPGTWVPARRTQRLSLRRGRLSCASRQGQQGRPAVHDRAVRPCRPGGTARLHDLRHCVEGYGRPAEFDVVHDHTGLTGAALGSMVEGPPVVQTLHWAWTPGSRRVPPDSAAGAAARGDQPASGGPGAVGVRIARVIPNAVPVERFPFRAARRGTTGYLAFVGRANPDKGRASGQLGR